MKGQLIHVGKQKMLTWLLVVCWFSILCVNITVTAQNTATPPSFEATDCPFERYDASESIIDCGYLVVPEFHANPDGDTLKLAVAIIRSPNKPKPDPIIYLEGGPGGSALYSYDAWLDHPLGKDRDIILIDQRGTGYSIPFLGCPEDLDIPDDASELEFTEACREALETEGVTLAAYISAENAADIAALRVALGYDQINLYGISYGTRLALTVMRDYPQGIRSVVLDSSYPPQVDAYEEQAVNAHRAYSVLFAGCKANRACDRAFPNLEAVFYETIERLNNEPLTVDLGDGEQDFYGDDLMAIVFDTLYSTSSIPYLPAIIYEISQDNFDTYLALQDGELGTDANEATSDDESADSSAAETYPDDLYAEFEGYLLDYLDYDDLDEMYAYLNTLDDDAYFDLIDEVVKSLSDEVYEDLLMIYLGFANFDDFSDYLDTLSDDDYDLLIDDFYNVLYAGGAIEEGDFVDLSDSDGMFNAVECYEELPFNDPDEAAALASNLPDVIQAYESAGLASMIDTCAVWGMPAPNQVEDQTVISTIPTLVLAGEYDPITPPAWGKAAAEGLSLAYYFEFPGVGHGAIDGGECPLNIALAFIADPEREPDGRCIADMPAPDFYTKP